MGFKLLIACCVIASGIQAQPLTDTAWIHYGNDAGGQRHGASSQIDTANVPKLAVAWTYRTGELDYYPENSEYGEKAAFEATPIMWNNTLYLTTPSCRVIALDASTGKEKWTYDPHINLDGGYSEATSRGVSLWPSPGSHSSENYLPRIIVPVVDGRLIALDAANGKVITSFGDSGIVDLRKGVGKISITSPPAIINDLIVVGSSMGDNERLDYEKGVVRAYHAATGKLAWSWDPIPRDPADPAYRTWKGKKVSKTGAANAWSIISADEKRNLVFVPTTSPSPDYYGGERLGNNNYASSIVALNASTGKIAWHFQTVHHDIWDYDNAAQPVLIDLDVNGKSVPAVAAGTKMGHLFILHRETGKPIFPVIEKKVPASAIAGEKASVTQPFPQHLPLLGLQNFSKSMAWGVTRADSLVAAKRIASLRYEGPFTPPSLEGSIIAPSNVGGVHWGGMCYDPGKRLLITNVNRIAALIRLVPRSEFEKEWTENRHLIRGEIGWQKGVPYVLKRDYLFTQKDSEMHVQTKPPWGTLAAVDLSTGKLAWEVPLGYMLDTSKYPEAKNWGSINFGGAICTAGGLVFVAATFDNHLRAFNSSNGQLLWQSLLPASAQATPMTYATKGKQYVVIAAGGHGKLRSKMGDYVVAYSLP